MASTVVSPSIARRSLRAADQPIETWSSCMAELGMESTLGRHGKAFELGDDRGLGVLGDHVPGVHPGIVGQERRQAVRAGHASIRSVRRSAMLATSAIGMARKSSWYAIARRGSFRWTPPVHRPAPPVVDGTGQLPVGDQLGGGERCPGGTMNLRRAAQ